MLTLAFVAVGWSVAAAERVPELEAEMRAAGFPVSQISKAESGGIVTTLRRLPEDNAAFAIGVTRIASPAADFVEEIRSLGRRESRPAASRTLQNGRFGTPPTREDLQSLRLDSAELRTLNDCRVGDCDVQVSGSTMEAARRIDWGAPGSEASAANLLKSMLVERAGAYLRQGGAGMAVYDDGNRPERVATGIEYIVASPGACQGRPSFCAYLLRFPHAEPPRGLEQFLFWSKEQITKPVVSIVHALIQRSDVPGGVRYDVALKHVYDSHFFHAYIELLTVLPRPGAEGFYLVRSILSLINPPRGWLRGVLLGRIKHCMRDQLGSDLAHTKRRLESAPRDPQRAAGQQRAPFEEH